MRRIAMAKKRKLLRRSIALQVMRRSMGVRALRTTTIRVTKPRITPGEGLAIIIGTQIGAGVLGLPYAAAQVGIIPAIIVLFGIMAILLGTALISLKMSVEMGGAQISTIAHRLLGRAGGLVMYASITIMSFGALLAYVAGMGSVLASLLGVSDTLGAIIFWVLASIVIYMGLEASGKAELIMSYIMFALFIGVIGMLAPHASPEKSMYMRWSGLFSIIGVSIFALGCHTVLPDVYKGLGSYEKTKKVVILGFLIPTAIYAAFMIAFLMAFGRETPQIATQALSSLYGSMGNFVGNIIPLVAITTSYIGIALAQQSNSTEYAKMKKPVAWGLTVLPPLIVYLAGITNFADVLAFAGSTGDLTAFIILPVIMWAVRWHRNRQRFKNAEDMSAR